MDLLTAPSKTEQVAALLRGRIMKGDCPPGGKLQGVRALAEQFGVSLWVVSSAMEILESERLIRREPSRGIFIEPLATAGALEVYMLLWGLKGKPNHYFDTVCKLVSPGHMPGDFGFLTRTVLAGEGVSLDRELAKIDHMPNVKCVLSNLSNFGEAELRKFKRLHCPALFFGDSEHSLPPQLDFNQILLLPRGGAVAAGFLAREGHKRATLLIGNRGIYFHDQFARETAAACARDGLALETIELPVGIGSWTLDAMRDYYRGLLESSPASFAAPLIVAGVEDALLGELSSLWRQAAPELPALRPQFDASYLDGFYQRVYQLLRELVAAPGITRKVEYFAPIILNDLRLGRRHRHENGVTVPIA